MLLHQSGKHLPLPGNAWHNSGKGEATMLKTLTRMIAGALLFFCIAGCTPLVVGAGAAVVADEVAEREQGGDGLF